MSEKVIPAVALPTIGEIEAAQQLVYDVMSPTPQFAWPLLSERAGAQVWVKHENHTPTGSFKARTAVVYAATLFAGPNAPAALVTATRGNHGQSVALAAQRFGVTAHIVVPRGNSPAKNAAMRAQGGRLIEYGDDFQEAREHAKELAAERGWHFVPSFHHDVIKGVATYWLEFFRAVPEMDVVYVPVGQGSGICACCAVRNGLGLKTQIVGVVAEEAPAYALSFAARRPIAAPARTLMGDGMACRVPDETALAIMLEYVQRVVQVSENGMQRAMHHYFMDTHNVVEGTGAAGLAAALMEKDRIAGRRVGLVATGGNVDLEMYMQALAYS